MPRNIIMFDQEQQNVIPMNQCKDKLAIQKDIKHLKMCEDDILADSNWKTNLMIQDQDQPIKRRNKGTRKNTSFQNKIINDHVWAMIKQLCKVGLNSSIQQYNKICEQVACQQSHIKTGINEERVKSIFCENIYFTQDQKTQLIQKFLYNFQNYQILNKVVNRLQKVGQFKQELVFLAVKIVAFISQNYQLKYRKYDQKFLQEEMPKTLYKISQYIVNQQNVKVINPEYFYNQNESNYMKIIQVWFYCIFSIKLGLTDNKYLMKNQSTKMQLQ